MTVLWRGPVRLYLNSFSKARELWSIDKGIGTREITAPGVVIDCPMLNTVVTDDIHVQPRAWLQGQCTVTQHRNGSIILTRK